MRFFNEKPSFFMEDEFLKNRFGGSKALIPLDKEKIVVESWKDIVIRFNGDPYRGRSRSVPVKSGIKVPNVGPWRM